MNKKRRGKSDEEKRATRERLEISRMDNVLPPYGYACMHKYMYGDSSPNLQMDGGDREKGNQELGEHQEES